MQNLRPCHGFLNPTLSTAQDRSWGLEALALLSQRTIVLSPPSRQPVVSFFSALDTEMAVAAISSGKHSASLMRIFAYIMKNLHRCWRSCPSFLCFLLSHQLLL